MVLWIIGGTDSFLVEVGELYLSVIVFFFRLKTQINLNISGNLFFNVKFQNENDSN